MTVLQLEEARRRSRGNPSTQVEPSEDQLEEPAARVFVEVPGVVVGPEDHPTRYSQEQLWVQQVRQELDGYMITMRQLRALPPEEVFLELSGITARLSELRLTCVRSESRRLAGLRTKEIDPLLDEADRQFRLHSRVQAVRQQEWEMTRGQV